MTVLSEVLSVKNMSKAYPGLTALRDVSFSLRRGEIRALCGENGAGKSTLVKILMGIVQPDSGSVAINGESETIRAPQQAQSLGLGLVAQELSLAPHLSILDNIWLGSAEVPLLHRRKGFAGGRSRRWQRWVSANGSVPRSNCRHPQFSFEPLGDDVGEVIECHF
jgi:ABC-type sugar transport system ATPase subunit